MLVVDDYQEAAELMALLLEASMEIRAFHATNGYQALSIAVDKHPDFVLPDTDMPGMDGIQTARLIRASLAGHSVVLIAYIGLKDVALVDDSRLFGHVLIRSCKLNELLEIRSSTQDR